MSQHLPSPNRTLEIITDRLRPAQIAQSGAHHQLPVATTAPAQNSG